LQIEFLEFFQFTYHLLSEAGRSDAAVAEQEKAKNALKRPISRSPRIASIGQGESNVSAFGCERKKPDLAIASGTKCHLPATGWP
jgi:hypothetical protein